LKGLIDALALQEILLFFFIGIFSPFKAIFFYSPFPFFLALPLGFQGNYPFV
jgi:hypothetical protein